MTIKMKKKKNLELYVHIPFCMQKCGYCDFLSITGKEETKEAYTEAMIKEIETYCELAEEYKVSTIFFGGGTPSVLSLESFEKICHVLYHAFDIAEDAELSIEVNPGTVSEEKLKKYQSLGFNRISFGLQSVHNEELKKLGRIHTYEDFIESYEMARYAGFQNINIDLISAIPGQTLQSWIETVKKAAEIGAEHLSVYSLIIEEGTPFFEKYGGKENLLAEKELPNEETERRMYIETRAILSEYGYKQYEISNYAKEGYICRHNLGYWERENYLGIGLGAASLIDNVRSTNISDMKRYCQNMKEYKAISPKCKAIEAQREILTLSRQMEEFMFLGLRKVEGISKNKFFSEFGKKIETIYGNCIEKLKTDRLLKEEGDNIALTERGFDLNNYVSGEFLLEEDN